MRLEAHLVGVGRQDDVVEHGHAYAAVLRKRGRRDMFQPSRRAILRSHLLVGFSLCYCSPFFHEGAFLNFIYLIGPSFHLLKGGASAEVKINKN